MNSVEERIEALPLSFLFFRIEEKRMAVEAQFCREVIGKRACHSFPCVSSDLLKGLVSLRGELYCCASLKTLLKLKEEKTHEISLGIVLSQGENRWVVSIDRVEGIENVSPQSLKWDESQEKSPFIKGVIMGKEPAEILDTSFLLYHLGRGEW